MPDIREERSLAELIGQLSQDMTLLVRQEVQLARTEIGDKISRATGDLVRLGTGAFVAYLGALALAATLVLLLVEVGLTPWLSALLVGAVLAGIGYVLLQRGLAALKRIDPTPVRTVETIKDDIEWAKEQRR